MNRVISTAEELAAIRQCSVIRESDGRVTEALEAWNRDESRYGIQWMETGTSWRVETQEITLPVTVLYEPELP